jgi:hypothetical protein
MPRQMRPVKGGGAPAGQGIRQAVKGKNETWDEEKIY